MEIRAMITNLDTGFRFEAFLNKEPVTDGIFWYGTATNPSLKVGLPIARISVVGSSAIKIIIVRTAKEIFSVELERSSDSLVIAA